MSSNNTPEIESKILEVTPEDLSEKLQLIGARQIFDGELRAQWLCNGDEWDDPEGKKKLRVRQEWDIVVVERKLAIKGINDGIKVADEKSFHADKFSDVVDVLLAVGFTRIWLPSVKRRVTYLIGDEKTGVKLDFDTYIELMGKYGTLDNPVIPTLMEIESKRSKQEVFDTAGLLGFDVIDLNDCGPRELFKYYHPGAPII